MNSSSSDDGTPKFSGVGVWTPYRVPKQELESQESIPPKSRLLLSTYFAPFYCYHDVKALKYSKTNGKYAKLRPLFGEELILERS